MDIVKCNNCGHVLISGNGCLLMFGKGTQFGCEKCGNTYTFGQEQPKEEISSIQQTSIDLLNSKVRNLL